MVVVDGELVEVVVVEVVVLVVVIVVVIGVIVVVGSVTVVNVVVFVVVGVVVCLLQIFIANSTNDGFSLFTVFVISTIIFIISKLSVRIKGISGNVVLRCSFNFPFTSYKLTVYSSTFVFLLTSWIFWTSTVISLAIFSSIDTFGLLKLNPPPFGKSLSGNSKGDVFISDTYCEFPTIWTYSQPFWVVVDVVVVVVVVDVVVGVTVVGIFVVVSEIRVVGSTNSVVGISVVVVVEVPVVRVASSKKLFSI